MRRNVIKFTLLFSINIAIASNPIIDSNYCLAYSDLNVVTYAKDAFDLDHYLCTYLSSAAELDKKMAVVDAFNTVAEEKAGELFLLFLQNKYKIKTIEELPNGEDQLILAYLYLTSNQSLSNEIIQRLEPKFKSRQSFGFLKFLTVSFNLNGTDDCQLWRNFQQFDVTNYPIKDIRASAVSTVADAIDTFKDYCSAETIVLTETKRKMSPKKDSSNRFKMKYQNGVYSVGLNINNKIELDFIFDSGASIVLIPEDVFSVLVRSGTVSKSDIVGKSDFKIADGSVVSKRIFKIKSLQLGNVIAYDIDAAVGSSDSDLLLGQSFIKKFKNVTLDNINSELIISK